MASAATLDTVALPISVETTNQLLSAFGDIRLLKTKNSPRIGKECALLEDGTDYVVLPKDGPHVRITGNCPRIGLKCAGVVDDFGVLPKDEPHVRIKDTRQLEGILNKNAALLGWIASLLHVASNSRPQ